MLFRSADFYKDSAEVKQLLIRQVSSPVLWEDSVLKMLDNDIDTFIEIGPGKTLSQFIKKILKKYNKKADIYKIEDMESLNNVIDTLSTK